MTDQDSELLINKAETGLAILISVSKSIGVLSFLKPIKKM